MTVSKKHKRPLPPDQEKPPKSLIIIGLGIVLLILGWIFGVVPFTIKYVECGEPPATIPWGVAGASTKPELPGEEEYGPGILKGYVCAKDTYLK